MASGNGEGVDITRGTIKKVLDRKFFPAGGLVFREGEIGTIAYIILKGQVDIYVGYQGSDERKLTTCKQGQMFGELALMADAARTATAVAGPEGCELLVFSQDKLKQKLDESDPIIRYWIEYLSERIIDLTTRKAG